MMNDAWRRISEKICGWPGKTFKRLSSAFSYGSPYYRHSLPVRIMHWMNAAFLATLLMSGLNIFNAHPALYLGKSSYSGVAPILEMGAGKTIRERSPESPAY